MSGVKYVEKNDFVEVFLSLGNLDIIYNFISILSDSVITDKAW
jgi:hypothetical protein